MGNVGSLIAFRLGASDAPILAKQLGDVDPRDLVNQPNYRAFVRLMVDGEKVRAFSMTAFPPVVREN